MFARAQYSKANKFIGLVADDQVVVCHYFAVGDLDLPPILSIDETWINPFVNLSRRNQYEFREIGFVAIRIACQQRDTLYRGMRSDIKIRQR